MEPIADLLKRFKRPGVRVAVARALVLEEADRWLQEEDPRLRGAAEAKAVVGRTLVVQCRSGVVAAEVRRRSPRLLAALGERHPGLPLDGLKCLVGGSTLEQ